QPALLLDHEALGVVVGVVEADLDAAVGRLADRAVGALAGHAAGEHAERGDEPAEAGEAGERSGHRGLRGADGGGGQAWRGTPSRSSSSTRRAARTGSARSRGRAPGTSRAGPMPEPAAGGRRAPATTRVASRRG